jgi:hypothetical protein
VIHTYRNADVLRSRSRRGSFLEILGFGVVVVLFLFGPFAFGWSRFTWTQAGVFGGFTGLVVVAMYAAHRREHYGTCGEIRLDDDGTCELETKHRVIRIHVSEIRSVRYSRDSEDGSENYTIYYRGGKLQVDDRMTGFLDFLTRLATLNPTVDLSSFPAVLAAAWPGLGRPAIGAHARVGRFLRSALFPLIVVGMLVWLAIQTLTDK